MVNVSGLTFDAANNQVIAFDNLDDEFWGYDVTTGVATLLSDTSAFAAFGFTHNGNDFVMSTTAGQFVTVDPTTAVVHSVPHDVRSPGRRCAHSCRCGGTGSHRVTVLPDTVRDQVDFGNQRRALTLSISDASISENGGSTTATVSRSGDTVGDLVVTLSDSDPSEVSLPVTIITIPAGASTSAPFVINGVDEAVVDGTQTVIITASAANHIDDSETPGCHRRRFGRPYHRRCCGQRRRLVDIHGDSQ